MASMASQQAQLPRRIVKVRGSALPASVKSDTTALHKDMHKISQRVVFGF
jgi:hypothetical protein